MRWEGNTAGTVIAPGDLPIADTRDAELGETLAADPLRARGTLDEREAPTSSERYAYGAVIGAGGMGQVLAADDQHLGRTVAVKRAHGGNEALRARFVHEAKIQARLEHPAIVPVYDMDTDASGQPFFTMKKLSGRTLSALIGQPDQEFSQHQLLHKLAEVCLAVEYAHRNGVIHRDIKPSNIMLGDYGEVYLLDWGIAKIAFAADAPAGATVEVAGSGMTTAGSVVGTPLYMAPEQWTGEAEVDYRVDVFSLGAVLFEILTGSPLRDPSTMKSLAGHVDVERRMKELGVELDPELVEFLCNSTADDPQMRIASARALHDRLSRFLEGARDASRRRELAGTHAEAAHMLAQGSDDVRHRAIAEAARAIALDPENERAHQTLGAIFARPLAETPASVRDETEKMRFAQAQRGIRIAALAYLATFLALPIIWFIENQSLQSVLPLEAALALAIGGAATFGFGKRPTRRQYWIAITGNAMYLALITRIMGPIAVTPALAMMSVCLFVQHGLTSRWGVIIGMHLVALTGPFLATELGLLTPTLELTVNEGTLIARSHLFQLQGQEPIYIMIASTAALILVAGLISVRRRRDDLRERAQTSLERWQLRLLVPGDRLPRSSSSKSDGFLG